MELNLSGNEIGDETDQKMVLSDVIMKLTKPVGILLNVLESFN